MLSAFTAKGITAFLIKQEGPEREAKAEERSFDFTPFLRQGRHDEVVIWLCDRSSGQTSGGRSGRSGIVSVAELSPRPSERNKATAAAASNAPDGLGSGRAAMVRTYHCSAVGEL